MKDFITPYKGRTIDFEQPVYVYRCLTRKGKVYSVKQNNKVVGHSEQLSLSDAEFIVNWSGKRRVIRTSNREVHAFIKGNITDLPTSELPLRVMYNPYSKDGFVGIAGEVKHELQKSKRVVINKNGVFSSCEFI